jgi:hypothetical protein
MAKDMQKEREWARHMPSEGENRKNAEQQRTREGVEEKVRSPQYQQAAGAAPNKADPKAAEENREFVEDTAMRYDKAEEKFAKGDR